MSGPRKTALPDNIPELTLSQFNELWDLLARNYAVEDPTESRVRRPRGHMIERRTEGSDSTGTALGQPIHDDVATYLHDRGLARATDADGRVHFTCPFQAEHTKDGDVTETTYFPAGTGGYERGHFRCLHAHCEKRTDADFLDGIGWTLEGFEVEEGNPVVILQALGVDERGDLVGAGPRTTPPPLAISASGRATKSGLYHPTIQNIIIALERPDLTGYFLVSDTFKDEILIGPRDGLRPIQEEDFTKLNLRLVQLGFDPRLSTQKVREAGLMVAREHTYDSGLLWAASLPQWDGVPRIERFYQEYLGSDNTEYARALGQYQWTAQAGRLLDPGCQADIVPIWVGAQGCGKTSAVRSLVISEDHYGEVNLGDDHKDISRSMRGKLVIELSELRGLRGREMEWTKAFVTRRSEEWIPKYKEFGHKFPRRFIMIGTSNRDDFLADETGNRRFAPIRVGNIKVDLIIKDRLQLWAEGKVRFEADGVLWREVEGLAQAEHHQFQIQDPWEERIAKYLYQTNWNNVVPIAKGYVTMEEILRDGLNLEMRQVNQFTAARVGSILKRLGYEPRRLCIDGQKRRVWVHELI